jgi:hypothetical protein
VDSGSSSLTRFNSKNIIDRRRELAELSRHTAFRSASWEDWARLVIDVISRILPWIMFYRATRQPVPSAFRKITALPIIGGVVLWDISGVFYWIQRIVVISNGPGFLSVNGMLSLAIVSFGILLLMGIVSAAAEWALKHIVPEWFRGVHKAKMVTNRPSYVVVRNAPLTTV